MNIEKSVSTVENLVIELGNLVIKQHESCIKVFEEKDFKLANFIIDNDSNVNNKEREINDEALKSLALLSPLAKDLRIDLSAVKVASELERIGDYAKNLAKFLIKNDSIDDSIIQYAIVMEKEVLELLKSVMKAYKNNDIDLAFEIPEAQESFELLAREFKMHLFSDKKIKIDDVFYLSSLFRSIERTFDHIVNICEDIIFLERGIIYEFD